MSIEPPRKSILQMTGHESDDSSADEWPDDLQAVAQQLTDDAQFLAARYPATVAAAAVAREVDKRQIVLPLETRLAVRRPRPFWQQAAAAVLFMGLGGAATAITIYSRSAGNGPVPHALHSPVASSEASGSETSGSKASGSGAVSDDENSVGVQAVGFNTVPAARTTLSEVEMLRIQSAAFEQVIRKLQDELARRDKEQADMQQTLESLRKEVSELRQRVNEAPPAGKDK
ncbi:MAG TPA: hypothetical protein VMJ32_05985 [Pirellulales bacterium]|nr:hypothetical protein [Pirellulales bacterium]